MRTLKLKNEREGAVAGQREEARGGVAGVSEENESLRETERGRKKNGWGRENEEEKEHNN